MMAILYLPSYDSDIMKISQLPTANSQHYLPIYIFKIKVTLVYNIM